MIAVPVEGGSFGDPKELFAYRRHPSRESNTFDVSRDGERFLVLEGRSVTPLTLIQNWTALLDR